MMPLDSDGTTDVTADNDDVEKPTTEDTKVRRDDWVFADVSDFVDSWLINIINRRVDGKNLKWDPEWWRYPEVSARLDALWMAWEAANASMAESSSAMSKWWVHDLEPHLRVILDGAHGPFAKYIHGQIPSGPPYLERIVPPSNWREILKSQRNSPIR